LRGKLWLVGLAYGLLFGMYVTVKSKHHHLLKWQKC